MLIAEEFFAEYNLTHKIYEVLESTQLTARESLNEIDLGYWYLYTAHQQNNGFGSNARSWITKDGNLATSLAFVVDESDFKITKFLPLVTSFTLHKLLFEFSLAKISIKWPNDIWFNGKKLAGILVQSVTNIRNNFTGIVIGVGANINTQVSRIAAQDTVSLKQITGQYFDVNEFAVKLAKNLIADIRILMFEGFSYFVDYINENLELYYKEKIKIVDNFDKVVISEAVIKKISNDGNLVVLDSSSHELHSISNGRIKEITKDIV